MLENKAENKNIKAISLSDIAERLGAKIHGDASIEISGIRPLESATARDLSFLGTSKSSKKNFLHLAKHSQAGALLIQEYDPSLEMAQIVTPEPLKAIISLTPLFEKYCEIVPGIHPNACIDETASVGNGVYIGPFAVIGANCVIGDGSIIHPHVVIYPGATIGAGCTIHSGAIIREGVTLGNNCLIQNGAVIGSDGFGYIPDKQLGHRRIPHIGTAVLEDDVDIGANATIDRATLGESRIGACTKLDNLVMLGHNVKVGKRTLMCSMVGVSGSCTIGDDVILAGQVGVADHVTIGNKVRAAGQTGIFSDIEDDRVIGGTPPMDTVRWHKTSSLLKKLPDLFTRLKKLEKHLGLEKNE
ncbi:MAG: UDP-3-O-(3-hydroxymyristoyl)glucosamine N-acyltransferase [Deltaproteobacteria bacterium]|nr:UDP-3-O-(3-hydroxymyristoyl)glucosamine N-acyltransferase [Deltaproteobacteria bacterium]